MKILPLLLLVVTILVSPRASAAPWSMDASALVFTEGKALGGSLGYGYRWNQLYIGGDILTHNYSETFGAGATGIAIKARSKLLMPGLVAKFFVPLTPQIHFYGGAGLSYAGTNTDYTATINGVNSSYSDSDDSLGTQLLAGVQIPYGPAGAIKLGWRYIRADDVSLLGVSRLKTDSHAFEFGINIDF